MVWNNELSILLASRNYRRDCRYHQVLERNRTSDEVDHKVSGV